MALFTSGVEDKQDYCTPVQSCFLMVSSMISSACRIKQYAFESLVLRIDLRGDDCSCDLLHASLVQTWHGHILCKTILVRISCPVHWNVSVVCSHIIQGKLNEVGQQEVKSLDWIWWPPPASSFDDNCFVDVVSILHHDSFLLQLLVILDVHG